MNRQKRLDIRIVFFFSRLIIIVFVVDVDHIQVLQNEILFYVEDVPCICFRFLMLPSNRVWNQYPETKAAL